MVNFDALAEFKNNIQVTLLTNKLAKRENKKKEKKTKKKKRPKNATSYKKATQSLLFSCVL